MPIRVWIADDHAVFRSGLKALLAAHSDILVIGESENGFDTLRGVKDHLPDILVLDLSMPGLSGVKVAEVVKESHSKTRVVALTMHEGAYYFEQALRVGVQGYVLKKSTAKKLVRAIRSVSKGRRYVDPAVDGDLRARQGGRHARLPSTRLDLLTPREQEVCGLLAFGNTSSQIAEQLHISKRTVDTHRAHLMTKLGFSSRAELVLFAIENGLMKVE